MKFAFSMFLFFIASNCTSQTLAESHISDEKPAIVQGLKIPPRASDPYANPSPQDYQMAWDEFVHRGHLIWGCRGVQTGQFVPASYCTSMPKVDSRWPDKKTPKGYSGVPSLE